MHIVLFTHPPFLTSQSMPRFAKMLQKGMQERGHTVDILTPQSHFHQLKTLAGIRKWLGYIDQYLIFPVQVKKKLQQYPADTLFVFADQALGPWVPLVKDRPHVVHCHDFLAQRSALGVIPENPTSWTGRQYQAFIRRGYQQAKNFISVSEKTKADLEDFLTSSPSLSEVVYNGMNRSFAPAQPAEARAILSKQTGIMLSNGYLLHVGGNQWYKNRTGVIELYNAWRRISKLQLPLLLIGEPANESLVKTHKTSPFSRDIYLLSGIDDITVRKAYAGASVFLFPSLAEGFGWPIAEAMACGCPVLTTNEAPMTEVSGGAAFLIPKKTNENTTCWAINGAAIIEQVVLLTDDARAAIVAKGLHNINRFNPATALDAIEAVYAQILKNSIAPASLQVEA